MQRSPQHRAGRRTAKSVGEEVGRARATTTTIPARACTTRGLNGRSTSSSSSPRLSKQQEGTSELITTDDR